MTDKDAFAAPESSPNNYDKGPSTDQPLFRAHPQLFRVGYLVIAFLWALLTFTISGFAAGFAGLLGVVLGCAWGVQGWSTKTR